MTRSLGEPVPLRHDLHGDGHRVRRGEREGADECSKRREAGIKVPADQGKGHQIYKDGNKIHAALCDGYTAVFEWDGEKAVNVSPGCSWYEMKKQEDGWVIRDLKNHRKHHYNSRGLLEAVEDRNGQKTLLSYHGEALDRIVTPLGGELHAAMRDGRLVQLRDSLGRTMQYRYENGLLSDVVHMDQGVTHYEYDERGFLVRAVDQAEVTYLCILSLWNTSKCGTGSFEVT